MVNTKTAQEAVTRALSFAARAARRVGRGSDPAGASARRGRWRGCYRPTVRLSARALNLTTLARLFHPERTRLPVVDAVRRLVALQAQEPASPYLALWNRLRDLDPADLDAAFDSYALVKAPLMRITLHAVAAQDRAAFHRAMTSTLRAARLNDRHFRESGLSAADADALVPHLLAFARRPRRREEIEAALAECLGGEPHPGVWWALRTVAPLVHAPFDEPWSFGRSPAFVTAPDANDVGHGASGSVPEAIEGRGAGDGAGDIPVAVVADDGLVPVVADDGHTAAVARLVWRYLAAFGPASRQDVAQFTLLRQGDVAPAFDALAGRLTTHENGHGAALYDLPDAPLSDADVPAPPRLLGMWDSVLLAYRDRGRVIPPAYRSTVIRRNGDVLSTVLVDGFVAGVWRIVDGTIEVTAFHPLADDAWDGIEREARGLLALLDGRDGAVYGRYGHWWSKLEGAQVRMLGRG